MAALIAFSTASTFHASFYDLGHFMSSLGLVPYLGTSLRINIVMKFNYKYLIVLWNGSLEIEVAPSDPLPYFTPSNGTFTFSNC